MAVEGAVQGLVAAFTFGFVVNAASAALFLYTKGHGSIFRDSKRLVLLLFLLSSALWAQIDFVTVLLDVTRSSMSCQVGIIFATVFDQLARFSIGQYLVWAMNHGQKPTVWQMIPQFMVLARFVAGAVFSGFTRPQVDTFCVATSSTFPVAVVVIVLDVVTLLLLTARAFSSANEVKESELARRVSHKLVLLGFAIWTASSVPLLLGIKTVELVARTAVPAIGLTILIIIVTGCAGTLTSDRGWSSRPPEAPSPRRINISRDISTADSDYPPSRYEDLKEAAIRSSTTFINPREAPTFSGEPNPALPWESQSKPEDAAAFGRARKVDQHGPKGGLFGFGKAAPSITVAKVMISNPIIQENDPQNPLNKIATIGLDEAARAERERRLKMQIEPPVPVPARPVTQNLSPEEVMKRGMSVKRKEVQSIASQPAGLQPEGTASSTAAQLSPGVEEIRRRSPRQASPEQMPSLPQPAQLASPANAEATLPMAATEPWLESPPLQQPPPKPAFTQAPVSRPEIRPSRQAPPSPKAPEPEPEKSALQRRPTIGLPMNPKARALKAAQDAGAQAQQQQIMFVNNIVYNDPTAVQNIIKGASDLAAKNAAANEGDDASVVNRPRPIPRKGDAPQPSPSPKHRRSRSGASMSRKSVLTSAPGSPTQLPPLPPPPLPGTSIRPQPNATKSMTVDEKMNMFFPTPPSGGATRPGSVAPQLPPIPMSFLNNTSPTSTHRSNRTTKTSFKTESILDVDEIPHRKIVENSKFSPMTEMDLAGDIGTSWLPGIEADHRSTGRSRQATTAKRASSPIIPPALPDRSSAWTENTEARTDDDATTNWGTIHSPELAVGVQVMKMPALPSTLRPAAERRAPAPPQAQAQAPENITFMLDELDFDHKGSSWLLESEPKDIKPERSTPSPSQWHRRVGDECPTFSAREKTRSRKAPAPTPLMLNGAPSRNKIIIQAEPSPLTSPEQALQEIQAQLKKLEDANRDSMNSPSRRLALLENLEREMGQQEDHWQEMKHDLGRDSMTSMQTVSQRNSRIEPVIVPPPISRDVGSRSSIALERRASRRARMRSGAPKGADAATWSPEMERATTTTSGWQKRLTEAQSEYMEAAAELLRSRNTTLIPMPTLSMAQLGSPTPPDSDQSDMEEALPRASNRLNTVAQTFHKSAAPAALWKPRRKAPSRPTLMWAPVQKKTPEPQARLPGLLVRPAQRKESAPLRISSSDLWRKPYVNDSRSGHGLWRPAWASAAPPAKTNRNSAQGVSQLPSQKAPRPVTQRPPRRNKRMTLLPDILESPKPLPDKRGTLGIFQFPWGERSDTAMATTTAPALGRPSYVAMPGTMASGGPSLGAAHDQRSRQLESSEYASSFFDDYDDSDEGHSEDGDGDESDDFDETTLWEIASLLKTDNVPSKNSLFPPPRPSTSAVAEHMNDIPSDDDRSRSSSREQSIVIGLGDVLFEQPMTSGAQKPKGRSLAIVTDENSDTWTLEEEYQPKRAPSPPRPVVGLPSNPRASKIPRAAPPAVAPAPAAAAPNPAPAPPKLSQIPRLSEKKAMKAAKAASAALWASVKTSEKPSATGLFALNTGRTIFRTTAKEPAAITITRKSRPSEAKPLAKLASAHLWTAIPTPKSSPAKLWAHPRFPRPTATPADWARALKDAVIASYTRRAAIPAAWDAALASALHLSSPARNPALRHPVFFAATLTTRAECFHPAATGYTHDAAAVHPCFFGSQALTCPKEAVHPAFACYAAKKLRRQRSRVSTRERPAERATSGSRRDSRVLSRSDSGRDKEEIRAQIRALEMEQERERELVPQVPAVPPMDANIMAQIEALEQERLFVQRAAQAEYKRRMSGGYGGLYVEQPIVQEPEQMQEPVLMAPEDVVASVQRRMSLARRQDSVKKVKGQGREEKEMEREKREKAVVAQGVSTLSVGLWAPPAAVDSNIVNAKPTLWTPGSSSRTNSKVAGGEDREAYARRARGRKMRQKLARRAEILQQIAMIERDIDPMAAFKAQKMWSVRGARAAANGSRHGRSWLHERKPSRVMLRY